MKTYTFKIAFLIFALLQISAYAQTEPALDALYQEKSFFEMRDELAKRSDDKSIELLFYRGAIANKFNEPEKSISYLQKYLKNGKEKIGEAYELLADNYVKTYQYAKAAGVYKAILEKYKTELEKEPEKIVDLNNAIGLYNSLGSVPVQKVFFDGNTKIQGTRDAAKLLNVPVTIGAQTTNFVFDTGANLSTVTASTAQKLGLQIIESAVSVGSSTDKKVESKLAFAPVMKIGNMTIRNAVFLVLADEALYFPQIKYQIGGIIGFPVIEAFRHITISKTDEILVPAKVKKSKIEPNLLFNSLTPVIGVKHNNRRMSFVFDTGAQNSVFYPAFFKAGEEEIKKQYKLQNVKLGGAGGFKEVPAYLVNLDLNVSGKTASFKNVRLITTPVNEDSRYFYGNLGQDLIRQFDKMTLDFESMYISFE